MSGGLPKEILEWSRLRHVGRGEQSEDRQPDENCADRPFHNHLNRIKRLSRASFRLQMAHASLGRNPTAQKNSSRRWAEPTSLSARWLLDDCFMTHYCSPLCEILAFYPAFKWRGNHHTLLQLRRSSILRAGATRRGFSLAGCPGWLLERRRGARFT